MYFIHKREGHPFVKNNSYFFNDLEDYVMARARGIFIGIMTGEMQVDDIGQLTVLDFSSEKRYQLENFEDSLLRKEIFKKLRYSSEHKYDEDHDDDDEILRLREDSCFAVVLERIKQYNDGFYLELTAIHKKYRKAICVQKNLSERQSPFNLQEIDYEEIDPVLETLLGQLIWEYLSINLDDF